MFKRVAAALCIFLIGLILLWPRTQHSQSSTSIARYLPTFSSAPDCRRVFQLYGDTVTGKVRFCSAVGSPGTWNDLVSGAGFTGGSVASPVTGPDGTAGAPTFAFTSDADGTGTGIFRSAANVIGFTTNGTERWVINSSGSFNPSTNNAVDIGNGSVNPRDVHVARNLVLYGSSSGSVSLAASATGNHFALPSASQFLWSTDTGLKRQAAAAVVITDGSTGFGDVRGNGSSFNYLEAYFSASDASSRTVSGRTVNIMGSGALPGLSWCSNCSLFWGANASGSGSDSGNPAAADLAIGRNAAGVLEVNNGTAGTYRDVVIRKTCYSGTTVCDHAGSGTPEGAVTASVGSTYRRTDGGAGTSFYVKESGSGNTGWVAK